MLFASHSNPQNLPEVLFALETGVKQLAFVAYVICTNYFPTVSVIRNYCPMASISAAADLSASSASAPPRQDSTTPVSTSSICAHVVTIGLA